LGDYLLETPEASSVVVGVNAEGLNEAPSEHIPFGRIANRKPDTILSMISMLTKTARLLRSTLESIAMPCSVNA
jgi:hypothetical protein